MGRASRWLKSLFGMKSSKDNSNPSAEKDKKKYSTGHSRRDSTISTPKVAWLRSCYNETEEQNKHAIAVAAATAAAADAAVAAAQAAMAVVRLTSHGRGTMFGGVQERWAAVKIQTLFRGYLARKALRALKGLVKIQALVRGYLVRKEASAMLHSMQALMRAQATVKSQKARGIIDNGGGRRLSASLDTAITMDESPKIVEVDTGRPKSRSRRINTDSLDFIDEYPPYQTLPSPFPTRFPSRLSIPDWGMGFAGDECRFCTAHRTSRITDTPITPSRSVFGNTFFRHGGDFPNYMSNTQCFNAKLRSHSAPKQRPDPGQKKRFSLSEMMESRCSFSGVQMQRSCSRAQEAIDFKNTVMGSLDFGREIRRRTICRSDGSDL